MTNKGKLCLFIFILISLALPPVWAQSKQGNENERPAVKIALSDDQSIIAERILYEGLKRSGYQMISKATGMRTAVADVNYGDAVILPMQTDGWDRMYPNLLKVPIAIDNVEFTAYTRSDDLFQFSSWGDLAGLRLGYRWQNEYIANNIARARASRLITVNDISELWDSLRSGEIDAALLPRISHFEHRFPRGIKRAGVIERQPVYTYVNKKYDYLVPLMEKAYEDMYSDGTMLSIHNHRRNFNYDNDQQISGGKSIILHLNSNNALNALERSQMDNIRSGIELGIENAGGEAPEYYSFYLNTNELHSQAGFNANVSDMIRTSFIERNPDLIIASGNEALDFVLDNYYLLFPNLPVLFYGAKALSGSMLYGLENNVTGIFETVSINETASVMLKLYPQTRRIYILNSHSNTGDIRMRDEIKKKLESGRPVLPVEFVFSENKPFNTILEEISSFESDTLVLIGDYNFDSTGTFYSGADVQKMVCGASLNPVFCLTSSYLGYGTLGGLVSATDAQSSAVSSRAVEILNGTAPSRIPVINDSISLNQWQFDYGAIKRFNIKVKNLPDNHIIINRPVPVWVSNSVEFWLILALAALFLLVLFGFMSFLKILAGKQADENMHLLMDAMPMCCQIFDRDYKIVECNNASIELFGFKDKNNYINHFLERCSPEFQPDGQYSTDKAKTFFNKAFEEGYCKFEWLHRSLSGEPIQVEITLIRIKHNKNGYLVAGYTRDLRKHKAYIAEIEKVQEDLKQARDNAECANRTKSTFLANMSHEIRTPLNSIVGFAELAQQSDNPGKINEYLDNIKHSSEWLLKIINDILDISKIESGKITLERIPFELHDVLSLCQMIIKPKAEEKGIGLYCYGESSINKKVLGDPVRLRQVLINLLSNAVKFTNTGTVKLLTSVVDGNNNNVRITFEVKDSGIGMNTEQISKILEPFIQAGNSVTRRFEGTGLGLSISKNIIELMGGTLDIESAPGIGSKFCFSVEFDLADYDTGVFYQESTLYDMKKPAFTGEVLICEDNDMNQQVICDHLAMVGLETVVALNGKEGVNLAAERMDKNKKPFDLILMDIHMPVMDGIEAASMIIGMGIKTPIVALTANIMHKDMELYRENGMSDCLGKPFTSQELWKCLSKFFTAVNNSAADETQFSGDYEKILKKTIVNFVRNNQTTYDRIVQASREGDIKLAHRICHTLKTNAMQIGKEKLNKAAAALENVFAKGENLSGEEDLKILKLELEHALNELAPLLEEISESRKTRALNAVYAGTPEILDLFSKLEMMLNNKNPECEDMIDDILSVPGTEDLARYIDMFDFRQAVLELSRLKNKWEMKYE